MTDPDASKTLWLPEQDNSHPEVSIVIPAMNEELTIREFISWCHEGLEKAVRQGRNINHRQFY